MPTGMPQAASALVGMGGAYQAFPPMPPPVVHSTGADDDLAAPNNGGGKLTRSQVGWLDLLSRSVVSIPVDCTLEEACRLIFFRTDDRSFVALLNEAMAVVLLGEPIPGRCGAPRLTMQDDAMAATESTEECVIEGEQEWNGCCCAATSLRLVLARPGGGHSGPVPCRIMRGCTLDDEADDALHGGTLELLEFACAKENSGHKTCRSWLMWWESPSRSTMSKN